MDQENEINLKDYQLCGSNRQLLFIIIILDDWTIFNNCTEEWKSKSGYDKRYQVEWGRNNHSWAMVIDGWLIILSGLTKIIETGKLPLFQWFEHS